MSFIIDLGFALLKAALLGKTDEEQGNEPRSGEELSDRFGYDSSDKDISDRFSDSYDKGRKA